MNAAIGVASEALALAGLRGRYVASFRNRPVGHERVVAEAGSGGGIRLVIETALAFERTALTQSVEAEFDCSWRPRSCIVSATSGSRELSLDLRLDDDDARMRFVVGGEAETRRIRVEERALLMIDNCFALHAVSAIVARGLVPASGRFTSIPACDALTATAPGAGAILMGGVDLGRPDLTLHLAREIDEHAWFKGAWVGRLALPRAQMVIEWQDDALREGGLR